MKLKAVSLKTNKIDQPLATLTKKVRSHRIDRLLVIYLSYFQATVTKVFNFYNTLDKKIKFK